MRNTAIRLPAPLRQAIAAQAAERGLSISAFIRAQLAANLTNPPKIIQSSTKP